MRIMVLCHLPVLNTGVPAGPQSTAIQVKTPSQHVLSAPNEKYTSLALLPASRLHKEDPWPTEEM